MGRLLRVRSQGGVFTTTYRRGPEVRLWEVSKVVRDADAAATSNSIKDKSVQNTATL